MPPFDPSDPAPKLYEFVPLADAVFDVPWAHWVNHDHPLKDGWCGELLITAQTYTPILVSTDQTGTFFRVGNVCALSSTSVRGMLRSLLEIASFARCTQIRKTPESDSGECPNPLNLRKYLPPCHAKPPTQDAADFVETLLGYVDKTEWPRAKARRSRISIKDFLLTPPKPDTLQNYRRDLESPRPRFPAQSAIQGAVSRRSRELKSLPAFSSFSGNIVLHNVLPVEVGGLLWALTWGGNANARHMLGRAKPYGFGALTMTVDWSRSILEPNATKSPELSLEPPKQARAWQQSFIDLMDQFTQSQWGRSWRETPQLKALTDLSAPPSE